MNKAIINQTLGMEVPDGFHPMDDGELRQVFLSDEPDRWGAWNKEGHVMITVMWKDYPPLLAKLADLKSACRKNERMTGKAYAGHSYQCGGFFSAAAGDQPAEGYRFTWLAGDVRQDGETVLMKRDRTVYSITCAGRAENEAADHETFAGILESIRFQ